MQSEEYIEYIGNFLDSIGENIFIIDLQGRVILWNTSLETQFYSREEALHRPLEELFPTFWEEFRNQVWGEILYREIIKEGKVRQLSRYPLNTRHNKIRYFDLKASPLRGNDGEILGCTLTMSDVTDEIHLENQLLRNARTTSLANLGASVAHEIRNPLNTISLNIQLIKEELEHPEHSSREEMIDIMESVLSEIKRLDGIIRNFLEFSRPPRPRKLLENPNKVIENVAKLLREQARQMNVKIHLDLGKLPMIPIDSNQLSQAIYNIALNAIQAMQENRGGNLEINSFDTRDYILIEVKDDGPGIQLVDGSQLFELFFSTKEQGTGLGLPIANQIIEQHDGRVVVENNIDGGACFSIYLPIVRENNNE